jgi:hypothetical protein
MSLERVAELSEHIARRLYLLRNWTPEEQAQHRADVKEREFLLIAARPGYGIFLAEARKRGTLDEHLPAQGCATEKDCDWQPWCRINGDCKRKTECHHQGTDSNAAQPERKP